MGAPQRLKYKLEGRAQVGQARDSTRYMAFQVETKGLFFLQEEAVPEGRGLGSWVGGGEGRGPRPWVCTHIPRRSSGDRV